MDYNNFRVGGNIIIIKRDINSEGREGIREFSEACPSIQPILPSSDRGEL